MTNSDGRARRGLGDVESPIDLDDRTARRVFRLLLLLLRLAADRRSRAGCTATTRGRIAPLGHAAAKLSASQQDGALLAGVGLQDSDESTFEELCENGVIL